MRKSTVKLKLFLIFFACNLSQASENDDDWKTKPEPSSPYGPVSPVRPTSPGTISSSELADLPVIAPASAASSAPIRTRSSRRLQRSAAIPPWILSPVGLFNPLAPGFGPANSFAGSGGLPAANPYVPNWPYAPLSSVRWGALSQEELREIEEEQESRRQQKQEENAKIIKEEKELLEQVKGRRTENFSEIDLPIRDDLYENDGNIPDGDDALLKARQYKNIFERYKSQLRPKLSGFSEPRELSHLLYMVLSGQVALDIAANEDENIKLMKLVNMCANYTGGCSWRKEALFIRGQIYEKGLLGQNQNLELAIKDYKTAVWDGSTEAREKMLKFWGNENNSIQELKYVRYHLKVLEKKYKNSNKPEDRERIRGEQTRIKALLKRKEQEELERTRVAPPSRRLQSIPEGVSVQLSPQDLFKRFVRALNRPQEVDLITLYTVAKEAVKDVPGRYHLVIPMLANHRRTYQMAFDLANEGASENILPAWESLAELELQYNKHILKSIEYYKKAVERKSIFAAGQLFRLYRKGLKYQDIEMRRNPEKSQDYLIKFLSVLGETIDIKNWHNLSILKRYFAPNHVLGDMVLEATRENTQELSQKAGAKYLSYFYHTLKFVKRYAEFTAAEHSLMEKYPFPEGRVQNFLKNLGDRNSASQRAHLSASGSTAKLQGKKRSGEDTGVRKRQRIESGGAPQHRANPNDEDGPKD